MGQIRLFLPRFGPLFRRFFAVLSRCPASWRQDGENAPKTAENGRKMAEIVVPKHPKSYVYPTPGRLRFSEHILDGLGVGEQTHTHGFPQ